MPPLRRPPLPGAPPFTRGVHPSMYRGRLWTMRQYAGFGDPAAANERFRDLLARGQTGLSVAFDLPTQMGYDADHAMARGEIGRAGVSIGAVDDHERLFAGIPLDRASVSMTINATAAVLLALHVAVARRRGMVPARLRGTVQNDVLKEFSARGCYIFPPGPSLRLATDVAAYCLRRLPEWHFVSVSGYHLREAGATAAQELGFTLANGIAYVAAARARGIDPAAYGRRMSFFFACHNRWLEEIAKFRAARRLWARLMRERFRVRDPRALACRMHVQTAGSTLTAQQPMNNAVRATFQALAAILGGTQSLHVNAYDEALGLPSGPAAALALRTQQILAHETRIPDVADPAGGARAIEDMTDRLEAEALTLVRSVDRQGGALEAVRRGWVRREIERSAYEAQMGVERGAQKVVGVNVHRGGPTPPVPPPVRVPAGFERGRIRDLRRLRARRRSGEALRALDAVRRAAGRATPLVPPILDAVEARATLGEICDALRGVFGTEDAATPEATRLRKGKIE